MKLCLKQEKFQLHSISAEAGSSEDTNQLCEIAARINADWIVVDGYQFDSAFQKALKKAEHKVLWIDDYGHAAPYCADLILNQNIYATAGLYPDRSADTEVLAGTSFALLRREFQRWQSFERKQIDRLKKILVTLGGGDPDNITLKVLQGINLLKDDRQLEIRVLVGAANPHMRALQQEIDSSSHQMSIVQNISDMPSAMTKADLIISAGGSTNWESLFLGLPAMMIIIAENQNPIADELAKQKLAINLGRGEDLVPERVADELRVLLDNPLRCNEISSRGRQQVDGYGAARVCQKLSGQKLFLRRAVINDCRFFVEISKRSSSSKRFIFKYGYSLR